MATSLFEDVDVIKKFSRHRGSALILYLLHFRKESHKNELVRYVGSQSATDQALAWLLRMKMVEVRKHTKEEGAQIKRYYYLTSNGIKIANTLVASMKTVMEVYRSIPDYKISK